MTKKQQGPPVKWRTIRLSKENEQFIQKIVDRNGFSFNKSANVLLDVVRAESGENVPRLEMVLKASE